jgi:Domain of unknown function (DUF4347)
MSHPGSTFSVAHRPSAHPPQPRWLQRRPEPAVPVSYAMRPGRANPADFAGRRSAHDSARVLFLDGRSGNVPAVIAGAAGRLRIVLLDAHTDGIAQMVHHLHERHAIHDLLISTADETGCLSLGNSCLTVANLYAYEDELRRIGSALAPTGRIRLLGRGTRTGRSEGALLVMLSRLTGATVEASPLPAHDEASWAVPWPEPSDHGGLEELARKVA